ncbi:peptidase S1 and S6 chymotrypsin/Hap [Stanieria sp. NIES-3757]|nr:peptidase S1 and S6 chymotrypsin/Hap [Stanieria sp. NIES-3757]
MKRQFFKSTLLLLLSSINYFSFLRSASATTQLNLNSRDLLSQNTEQLNVERTADLILTKTLNTDQNLIAAIYGQDDRVAISNTTQTPWDNIAKLKIKFPDGKEFVGSGAAINSTHIITAAHNVFLKNNGGKADLNSISVSFDKYNEVKVTKVRILEGWINDGNWEFKNNQWRPLNHQDDLALLTLDRPLQDFNQVFNLKALDHSLFSKIKINISGYPDNPKTAWKNLPLKTASGKISFIDNYQFFYNETLDTQAGQSGSPVWYFDSDTKTYNIVGIHVQGNKWINGNFYNVATQITEDKLTLIQGWVKKDLQDYGEEKLASTN